MQVRDGSIWTQGGHVGVERGGEVELAPRWVGTGKKAAPPLTARGEQLARCRAATDAEAVGLRTW